MQNMMKRVTISIFTFLLALAGTVLLAGSPAHADVSCGGTKSPSPADPGGKDVYLAVSTSTPCPANEVFWAYFHSYGEELEIGVHNAESVGYTSIWVDLKVYNSSGTVIDTDKLMFRGNEASHEVDVHNLGTPDGSGDIQEGLKVSLRLCGKLGIGYTKCTVYVNGIA